VRASGKGANPKGQITGANQMKIDSTTVPRIIGL
jgi:hypothetical protein